MHENAFENFVCGNGGYFVQGDMSEGLRWFKHVFYGGNQSMKKPVAIHENWIE